MDAVNIGLLLFHKASDAKLKEAMLGFARRYGLLGLMTALPTTPRFVEYEKVYLPKNPYIRQETMETQDYLKLFFPFTMPDFHKRGIESLWQVSGEDRMQIALAMTFRDEPQAKAMSFMRGYGERFDWLKEVSGTGRLPSRPLTSMSTTGSILIETHRSFTGRASRALRAVCRAIIWSCATIP